MGKDARTDYDWGDDLAGRIHADMAAADYLTDMIAANPNLDLLVLERSADSLLKTVKPSIGHLGVLSIALFNVAAVFLETDGTFSVVSRDKAGARTAFPEPPA